MCIERIESVILHGPFLGRTTGGLEQKMKNVLGIDIGSVSIGLCEITADKNIVRTAYQFHQGKIADTLRAMLSGFDLKGIGSIAATSSTPSFIKAVKSYDTQVAIIAAAKHLHEDVRYVLNVGGERFSLIEFDEEGDYLSCRSNTSCAAGTGSFLDQQALRLDLAGSEELSATAALNSGSMPKIASRCAVFAKTDLIHAQQEGYSLSEICDGLCHGLAKNIVDTLFTNQNIDGSVVFCGGVSKNPTVSKHIQGLTGKKIITDEISHVFGALGAGISLLREGIHSGMEIVSAGDIILEPIKDKQYSYGPLTLVRSQYPDSTGTESYVHPVRTRKIPSAVEVEVYDGLSQRCEYDVYLGVDVGST
ncbi:MAG TPA: CoA activase, partial [Deltaproteobacteria bacterium]|nr:CoA activase [Deltaproteobacteria bacterium]